MDYRGGGFEVEATLPAKRTLEEFRAWIEAGNVPPSTMTDAESEWLKNRELKSKEKQIPATSA